MCISEQKLLLPNVPENHVNENNQPPQPRVNTQAQEQLYLVANSSVSQSSHPIFNPSIFTSKEYLQNHIKNQLQKLLFLTDLNIKSHKFK